jgi:hypothetical protein
LGNKKNKELIGLKKLVILVCLVLFASMALSENFKELPVCDSFHQFFDLGNGMLKPPSFGKKLCYCTITDPCNSPIDDPVLDDYQELNN